MHLIVLVHGLFGNPKHLNSMQQSIEKEASNHGVAVKVHKANCMSPVGTFDGIIDNGELLVKEIILKIEEFKAKRLSIVGYSMGGLFSRYAIGQLHKIQLFSRVKPVVFATFATPHLGSRNVQNTYFSKLFNFVGPFISGNTGMDIFRRSPVLSDISQEGSVYIEGLKMFEHLYIFSNACRDRTVPFWTSFISDSNPFIDLQPTTYQDYQFLVDLDATPTSHQQKKNLGQFLFAICVPPLLGILIVIMATISATSWTKKLLKWKHHKNKINEEFFNDVGSALNEVLEKPNQVESIHSSSTPKPVSNVSFKRNLYLNRDEDSNLNVLNSLNWKKYAVMLHSLNTHGEIVDRMRRSNDGKKLMDFFANRLVKEISQYTK